MVDVDIYVTDDDGKRSEWILKDAVVMPNYNAFGEELLIATN